MLHLQNLPSVALVTTGRTGSDFLQSLLDSHPQIATFNGHFLPYSQFFSLAKTFESDKGIVSDAADEFIGCYLYKLISVYDIQEAKDCLGVNFDQSFRIDTEEFKHHLVGLMGKIPLNTKDFLLAVYGAYNLCLGHKIETCKVILHHPHLEYELKFLLKDFPVTRIIYTSRDPRANFFSHVDHFRRYYSTHDNQAHIYLCLKMALDDSASADIWGLEYTATRLEDLPREDVIRDLARWLGIEFTPIMLRSTWAGLDWHGDRISRKKFSATGWSKNRTENGWHEGLGCIEKYVLNFILNKRLMWYGYEYKKINLLDALLCFILISAPFKCERRLLHPKHIINIFTHGTNQEKIQFLVAPFFFLLRIKLCYRYFWISLADKPFKRNWLKGNQQYYSD